MPEVDDAAPTAVVVAEVPVVAGDAGRDDSASVDPQVTATLRAIRGEKKAAEDARKAAEKRAADAEAQLTAAREKEMSELQRAQEQVKRLEREAADARVEALRFRVAAQHQISREDAETFLTAADEAGITRQAERLAELSRARGDADAAAAAKAAEPRSPKADPSQGTRQGSVQSSVQSGADRRRQEIAAERDARAAVRI